MAVQRIDGTKDIINGLAAVSSGDKKVLLYDNTQRTQHLPDASGVIFAVLANRYLHHGGVSGSGNWEH